MGRLSPFNFSFSVRVFQEHKREKEVPAGVPLSSKPSERGRAAPSSEKLASKTEGLGPSSKTTGSRVEDGKTAVVLAQGSLGPRPCL